jgi:hypothetical protein
MILAKNRTTSKMDMPQLYIQLLEQLGQWIIPKDLRHLTNCAEIVAAILESESACLAHWIPYLSHRNCQARSQMERFGGIEPRFKDYKSGTFDILRSKIRDAQALSNLLMMVEIAEILAIRLGLLAIEIRQRSKIDWHSQRGLSLLQLGIRTIKSLCHQALSLPLLTPIPWQKILPACASNKKRAKLERRIEFSKVMSFAY